MLVFIYNNFKNNLNFTHPSTNCNNQCAPQTKQENLGTKNFKLVN